MQTEHHNFKPSPPKHQIVIACNKLNGPANIGALFRLAEAMGVESLFFDTIINTDSRRMRKTARSTFENMEYLDEVDLKSTITGYKESGYTILGLELTSESWTLQSITKGINDKWLLVIGNEQYGIEDSILESVDYQVHIPMFGSNSSMNVIQATAMALYELRRDE